MKTIQNGVFVFFQKRTKTCFFSKKQKWFELKKQQNTGGLFC